MPRFSRFCCTPENKERIPSSKVTFFLNESITRLHDWLRSGFIIPPGSGGVKIASDKDKMKANFVSVCPSAADASGSGSPHQDDMPVLYIYACLPKGADSSSSSRGEIRVDISCQSMDLAAELVQDMAKFFRYVLCLYS